MTKPALFTFASDANYPAGAEAFSATPTKVAPTSGYRAQGFAPKDHPPAQVVNYLLNEIANWIAYLDAANIDGDLTVTGNLHVTGTSALDGNVTLGGNVALGAGKITHNDHTMTGHIHYPSVISFSGTGPSDNGVLAGITVAASSSVMIPIPVTLRSNEKLRSIKVGFADGGAGSGTTSIGDCSLYVQREPGIENWALFGSIVSIVPTEVDCTIPVGVGSAVPALIPDNQPLWLRVDVPGGSTCKPSSWLATFFVD